MPDNKKELEILLRFGVDEATANKIVGDMRKVSAESKKVEQSAEASRRAWMRMAEQGEKLASIGLRIGAIGGALLGPITLAANQYVKSVGMASDESRRWIDAQKEIEDSTLRIGKVSAETLIPYMEKAAELARSVAGMIESNPDIIKAAVIGGTVLAGGGAALSTVGALVNSIGKLGALLGVGKAAAGTAGAAGAGATGAGAAAGGAGLSALGVAGSALGGVAAGGLIYDWLAKNLGLGGGTRLSQFATVGAKGIGDIFGKGDEWALAVGKATGAFDQAAEAAEKAAAAVEKAGKSEQDIQAEKGLGTYVAFRKAQATADANYQKDVTRINDNTGKALVKAEQAYGRERSKALGDFNRIRVKEIQDFYKSEKETEESDRKDRLKQAARFGKDVERNEQDHQLAMARMAQDHAKTMRSAIANNDARAAFEEIQNYNEQRDRAEHDHQIEVGRTNADYAEQITEENAQKQGERNRRLADFQARQNDAKVEFDRQQKERKADYDAQVAEIKAAGKDQLSALNASRSEQKAAQAAAFTEQLNALGIYLGNEKQLRDQYYADMLSSFKSFMQGGGVARPGVGPGVGMGDLLVREQEIQGGARSGLSGGANLNFAPSYTGMGEQDRSWYTQVARQQAEQVVLQLAQSVRRGR